MPILKFEKEIDPEETESAVFVLRFTADTSIEEVTAKHETIKQAFVNAGYSLYRKHSNLLSKKSLAGNKIIMLHAMPFAHKTITITLTKHKLNKKTLQILADLAMENL